IWIRKRKAKRWLIKNWRISTQLEMYKWRQMKTRTEQNSYNPYLHNCIYFKIIFYLKLLFNYISGFSFSAYNSIPIQINSPIIIYRIVDSFLYNFIQSLWGDKARHGLLLPPHNFFRHRHLLFF